MLHLVLYQPEIPPNTGNIIRLCANTGAQLHLIHPLGFSLNEKKLRRAGLDYHEFTSIKEYENYPDFIKKNSQLRLFACTTKGSNPYHRPQYKSHDAFVLGPETRGLPDQVLETFSQDNRIKIPMQAQSRSLNLSNAAAIILFEAWRQCDFQTLTDGE
jgi:tRNA (cytidine/uridine-2'-O-)-methyltransferase